MWPGGGLVTAPISVGQVSVEVVASAAGFAKSLRRAVVKEFKSAGLDKTVADTLSRRPAQVPVRVADPTRQVTDAVRRAERAAPPITVKVDVDRKTVAQVGRQVAGALSGGTSALLKTVGVTLGAGVAAAALAGLTSAAAAAVPVLIGLGAAAATAGGALVAVPGAAAVAAAALGVLHLGLVGVEDAFEALVDGDADKFKEALKSLAPSARKAFKELAKLRPTFDRLRLDVQNRLFAGLAAQIRDLARTHLPAAQSASRRLADVWNGALRSAVGTLLTQQAKLDLRRILDSAVAAARNLAAGVAPIAAALRDVVVVGAQITAELTEGVGVELGGLAQRISQMRASGELKAIFDDGLAALRQFGGLARDVVGILGGIGRAFGGDTAAGVFAFFDRLNAAINSVQGQQVLRSLFQALADIGVALTPVLVAVGQALVPVAEGIGAIAVAFAPGLTVLAEALGSALAGLAPAAIALAPALVGIAAALAPLGQIIADLVVAFAPGFAVLVAALAEALNQLAPAAAPVGQALAAIAQAVAPLLPLIGAQLANALVVIAGAASQVAAALGPLVAVLAEGLLAAAQEMLPVLLALSTAVLPVLAQAATELAAAFAPLVPVLTQIASQIAGAILAALPQFVEVLAQLLPIVAQLAPLLGQALLAALQAIAPMLPELVSAGLALAQAFLELLVAVAPLLVPLAKMAALFISALAQSGALTGGLRILTGLIHLVTGSLRVATAVIRAILSPLNSARQSFSGFGSAASAAANTVLSVMRGLPGRIRSAVGSLGGLLLAAGRNVVQGLIDGIKAKAGDLASTAASLAGTIRNFLPFSPAKEGPLSGRGNPYYSGRSIVDLLAGGVTANLSAASDAAGRLAAQFAIDPGLDLAAAGLVAVPRPAGIAGGLELHVVVDDGAVPDLIRVEVDNQFGALADARVYNTA